MIPYGRQGINDADVAAVAAALRDPFLTQGPRIAAFETALAEACGSRYAVAYASGTAALHGAYFAAGMGPGKRLLTSPITFAATSNAALYLGGDVTFADVDPDTVILDSGAAERAATPDVAVVAPVYLGGHVADAEPLVALARRRGWRVVEDACHALGARYKTAVGEHVVGSCAHADMSCFSFHPVKHITTGEGGAVTTNDEQLYRALLRFRTHGITRDPSELTVDEGPWYYEQHDLGFNYRITDFQCALGLSQLGRLGGFVASRRRLAARYDAAFADIGVRYLREPLSSVSSYHLYVIRVPADERRRIFEALRADGIGVNVHYVPVYRHPYYRRRFPDPPPCPEAERYYAEAITLPLFPDLSERDQDVVIEAVRQRTAGR